MLRSLRDSRHGGQGNGFRVDGVSETERWVAARPCQTLLQRLRVDARAATKETAVWNRWGKGYFDTIKKWRLHWGTVPANFRQSVR